MGHRGEETWLIREGMSKWTKNPRLASGNYRPWKGQQIQDRRPWRTNYESTAGTVKDNYTRTLVEDICREKSNWDNDLIKSLLTFLQGVNEKQRPAQVLSPLPHSWLWLVTSGVYDPFFPIWFTSTLKTEAVCPSKIFECTCENTPYHNPEDYNMNSRN